MSSEINRPFQLLPIFRQRVWGRENLHPYFSKQADECIGEVWFTFEENFTNFGVRFGDLLRDNPELLGAAADPKHPGACPLLVKLLFTSERLSVQVHPDDEYAQRHHNSLGKTEAWYVVDSQAPGEVAVGLRRHVSTDEFKQAAQSGEIEQLLHWKKVHAGDVIFVPARTVHAIGGGLIICEVQENSDITYRLYDYGRPRELHLEHGIRVAKLAPNGTEAEPVKLLEWRDELVACPYFRMERLRPQSPLRIAGGLPYYLVLICVKGSGMIGGNAFRGGEVWFLPAQSSDLKIEGAGSEWILAYTAPEPMPNLAEW